MQTPNRNVNEKRSSFTLQRKSMSTGREINQLSLNELQLHDSMVTVNPIEEAFQQFKLKLSEASMKWKRSQENITLLELASIKVTCYLSDL